MQDRAKTRAAKGGEARALPKRRMFMLGNGKPVSPSQTERFCEAAIASTLDCGHEMRAWFQVGFAAAVDMIARGTIDFGSGPELAMQAAWGDVHNITVEPNRATDVMKLEV